MSAFDGGGVRLRGGLSQRQAKHYKEMSKIATHRHLTWLSEAGKQASGGRLT